MSFNCISQLLQNSILNVLQGFQTSFRLIWMKLNTYIILTNISQMIVNFENEKGINGNVFHNCVLSVIVKLFFQENLLLFFPIRHWADF